MKLRDFAREGGDNFEISLKLGDNRLIGAVG